MIRVSTRSIRLCIWAAAFGLLVGAASPATALAQLELAPYAGLLLPASNTAEWPRDDVAPGVVTQFRASPAAVLGTRLSVWLSDHIGLEGSAAYAPSGLKVRNVSSEASNPWQILDANLLLATGRALLRFGADGTTSYHVGAGAGLVSRSGDGFENVEGTLDFAAVLAAGLRIDLGALSVRWDLEDYISSAELTLVDPAMLVEDVELESRIQHDFVVSQALVVRIGRP